VLYGHVMDPATGERVDEALLLLMRAPRSFTREDVVELHCHGGLVAVRRVLKAVLDAGARLAAAGEFSQRAFLNGRLDLTRAEAIACMRRALDEFLIEGIKTTIPFYRTLFGHINYLKGQVDTGFVEREFFVDNGK
jgi:tRNA U34 5-carboxymethylaminomethyl modifying GTPase MnmE/TrmE